ncbi:hypothetical protein [Streptomyces rubiginosohelvolus]
MIAVTAGEEHDHERRPEFFITTPAWELRGRPHGAPVSCACETAAAK